MQPTIVKRHLNKTGATVFASPNACTAINATQVGNKHALDWFQELELVVPSMVNGFI